MVRTRFAPSPTGQLHIGGARTALFNWLFAKHHKGRFVLRIEDTDRERSRDEYTQGILDGLAWLGIVHDEGPFFQSARMELYKEHALRLLQEGHAYKCYCTTQELEEKRKRALKEGQKPAYDRTCREKTIEDPDKPHVIRFKTPLSGTVAFHDLVRGEISFQCDELDDLVILRTDQTPTYNFTVVVDDALMGITHIIRGDDHINNTPRQILMYEALKFAVPRFAHVPLIHGKDRARLSKRHGATSLLEYREEGFLPEALMNYLARLGWAHGDDEIFSKEELIEKFDLPNVGRSPAIFDMDKLLWLNDHYMKTLPVEVVAERLAPFITAQSRTAPDRAKLIQIIRNLLGRAKTLKEMAQMAGFFFGEEIEYETSAKAKFLTQAARPILEQFLKDFQELPSLDEASQRALIESIARDHGKKLVDIVQPIRVALSGKAVSPGIFEVIGILGKDLVKKRIERAISLIS
ncbi:MAG TPA: glutamate--tRNA ligase [Syntrophorhabdales bacterium]|nr:glutamate--tRNA ligase [Syntrophorhabdales bacterium]